MARTKTYNLNSVSYFKELSDVESAIIVGGIQPQPLPPGISSTYHLDYLTNFQQYLKQGIVIGS